MNKVNLYLNPFYHPSAPTLAKANYGWCALSHLTVEALKIQNRSFKVIATIFAAIFDATIGFGIVGTAFYNPSAFLYNNTYVKLVNCSIELQKTQTNKKWNQTALKTWAVIGGSLALVAGLYYFRTFGIEKKDQTQAKSSPLPESKRNETSLSPFLLGASLLGVLFLVGGKIFNKKSKEAPLEAPFTWAFKDQIPSVEELSKCGIKPTGGIKCSDPRIPYLDSLYSKCRNELMAAFGRPPSEEIAKNQRIKIDPSKNFWQENPSLVKAADALLRSANALSLCSLNDLENYSLSLNTDPSQSKKWTPKDVLLSQCSNHYKYFFCLPNTYLLIRRAEVWGNAAPFKADTDVITTRRTYRGLATEFGLKFISSFYDADTLQNQWREIHNNYCQRVVEFSKPNNPLSGIGEGVVANNATKSGKDGILVADYRYLSWTKDFMDTTDHPLPTGGTSQPT